MAKPGAGCLEGGTAGFEPHCAAQSPLSNQELLERRVVRVTGRAAAVEGLAVGLVQRRAAPQALHQIRVREKRYAERDQIGFPIPDQFVVGYGLDFNDEYRHLPYIGVLPPQS